ncbi:MAG: aa3-type cytochrome c oxidase subunit IV [Pseudomonadota bacterium]
MAEEKDKTPVDNAMDYAEHERTFDLFVQGSKLLTIVSVALLIAMAFGFFAGGGLLGGTVAFFILAIIGYVFL